MNRELLHQSAVRISIVLIFSVISASILYSQTEQHKTRLPALAGIHESSGSSMGKVMPASGDTLLDESFEGEFGGWTAIDNDGNGETWAVYGEQPPQDTVAHSGLHGTGCFYNSEGNDDWLISPLLTLPADGSDITFSFWARSHSGDYPEDFQVKLSTSGAEINDFTESLATVNDVPFNWARYSYRLNDYAGESVYLAVRCVSVDDYYLWADDFLLVAEPQSIDIPEILSAEYGPPAAENSWERFTIPLTAETFGVESAVFEAAMENIGLFRIKTEMHTGNDEGGVDNVALGTVFASDFDSGTEGWGVMGDGTLSWSETDGNPGGYIHISDWASGDWHYAVAPDDWTGNWSDFIGEDLTFDYKTDHPSYSAVVELHTDISSRIVLTAGSLTLHPGETTQVVARVIPAPDQDLELTFSSSENELSIQSTATVPAGEDSVVVAMIADADVTEEMSAVVSATASGYSTARLTFQVIPREVTSLTGQVTDATTGDPIAGAVVSVAGFETTTGFDGTYTISDIPVPGLRAEFMGVPDSGAAPLSVRFQDLSSVGTQTVVVSAQGYLTYTNAQVALSAGEERVLDISLSPVLTDGKLRLVLNWKAEPPDLDAHLVTPVIGDSSYHVYWWEQGSADSLPHAVLDHDDIDGFGPETITFHQFYPGTYSYFIYDFDETGGLAGSDAVVQIYDESGLIRTVQVPKTGTGDFWKVCDIDGESRTITVYNTIVTEPPAESSVGAERRKESGNQDISVSSVAAEITSWNWDFGDGGTSTLQHPEHLFESPGVYSVTLTVSDGTDSDMEAKTGYITVHDPTSVDEQTGVPLPGGLTLRGNYPNPFNPVTTIAYELPDAGDVLLTVYDTRGRKMTELVNTHQNAGRHTVQWNAANFPTGIYMVCLKWENRSVKTKLTLLK